MPQGVEKTVNKQEFADLLSDLKGEKCSTSNSRTSTFPVSPRVIEFGDTALVVTDPNAFIPRIGTALRTQDIHHRANLVRYVPEDHVGDVGPFVKFQSSDTTPPMETEL